MMEPKQLFSTAAAGAKDYRKRGKDSTYIIEGSRAQRADVSLRIRHEKKHERMTVRRNRAIGSPNQTASSVNWEAMKSNVEIFRQAAGDSDLITCIRHLNQIRRQLTSVNNAVVVDKALNTGAFSLLVDCLYTTNPPELVQEASFTICHLSRYQPEKVAHFKNCLHVMCDTFHNTSEPKTQENCALFLGNLGVKNTALQKEMLQSELARRALGRLVSSHRPKPSTLKEAIWALRIITKACATADPSLALEWTNVFTTPLGEIIATIIAERGDLRDANDRELLQNCFGALAGLLSQKQSDLFACYGPSLCCEAMKSCLISPARNQKRSFAPTIIQATKCLGLIASSRSPEKTLESDFLFMIPELLKVKDKDCKKEVASTFHKMVAEHKVASRINDQQLVGLLAEFVNHLEFEEESALIIGSLLCHGDPSMTSIVVSNQGALRSLCAGLGRPDISTQKLLLVGVRNLMKVGSGSFNERLHESGIIEQVHKIQSQVLDQDVSDLIDIVLDADQIKADSLEEPGLTDECSYHDNEAYNEMLSGN